MRHRHAGRQLNRTSSHRRAMFHNLCNSLIKHGLIKTTVPKAKELRRYIEPFITAAKKDTLAARRYVFDHLRSRESVATLFSVLAPRYQTRLGGYTRVIKCGNRPGDNAPMAIIALVEEAAPVAVEKKKSTRRSKKVEKVEEVVIEDAVVIEETAPKNEDATEA